MSEKNYTYAIGRRKTSTATVRLFDSAEESMINEKVASQLYPGAVDQQVLAEPFIAAELDPKKYSFTAKVSGGGSKSQLGAIRHALARALVKFDPGVKTKVKKAGLLTRDARMVERKKTGLHKARKAEQYSKR